MMYQSYGTIPNVVEMGATSTDPLREKFTGKEYDKDDDKNGAPGIGLLYFGVRYYDAEVGRWISTDPANQFWDSYRYTTNPIIYFDPNGLTEYIVIALGEY